MTKKLIFDLGFNDGADTAYYLKEGFNVVAVEANPRLYAAGCVLFSEAIRKGSVILLNRVFSDINSNRIPFFIHPKHKDWSTADKAKADYWSCKYETVKVKSINYHELIKYGIPYYIKCDVEGFDYMLIKQISESSVKPNFVSCELSRLDYFKTFSYLFTAGYSGFQLINQARNSEGSSGNFGHLLPKTEWMSFDECLTRYMKYKELKAIDNRNLALGWIDIHAKQ